MTSPLQKFEYPSPPGFDEFTEEEWAAVEGARIEPLTKEQQEMIDGFRTCQILTAEDLNIVINAR